MQPRQTSIRLLRKHGLRVQLSLLVAVIGVLAATACGTITETKGITRLGTSSDDSTLYAGITCGGAAEACGGLNYQSVDGGMSWTNLTFETISVISYPIAWGGSRVETPRGRYTITSSGVSRLDENGQSESVYSTRYLKRGNNSWMQQQSTTDLGRREIAKEPASITFDEQSGNVIVAMGIQGVAVETPEGNWVRRAVGGYTPTDFSFANKLRVLLSFSSSWTLPLALALTFTGIGLTISQSNRRYGWLLVPGFLIAMVTLIASIYMLFVLGSLVAVPLTFSFMTTALVAASFYRLRWVQVSLLYSIGICATLLSLLLLTISGVPPFGDEPGPDFISPVIGATAAIAGAASIVASKQLLCHWRVVAMFAIGVGAFTVLATLLWLFGLGITFGTFKILLTILLLAAALRFAAYIRSKVAKPNTSTNPTPQLEI